MISNNIVNAEENKTQAIDSSVDGPLKRILQKLGSFSTLLFQIIIFAAEAAAADPPVIEIGYNERLTIDVGLLNMTSGEFDLLKEDRGIWEERFLTFEVIEYPNGNQDGKWQVTFNPSTIKVEKGALLKTNMTLSLRSVRNSENPIQNGILKIRIKDTWAVGAIYFPKRENYDSLFTYLFIAPFWFLNGVVLGDWALQLSGKTVVDYIYLDVLVKVKPYHDVNFDSVPYKVFEPDQIVSIPVTLKNLGNYNDTFSFRIKGKNTGIRIAEPTSITLAPGEEKSSYLGISIPQSIFDYGTIHNIDIEAYSIDEENVTIATRTVTLESKGVYFNELSSAGIIFLLLLFVVLIIFTFIRRKKIISEILIKPDKQWELPKEQKYLEKIKKKDKEKYKETLDMMRDEYKSALLWYNSYIKSIITKKPKKKKTKKEKPKKEKIKKEKIKKEKIKKEKAKEEKEDKEEKEEKKVENEIIEEDIDKKEEIKDRKNIIDDFEKQRAFERVRKSQSKQRRKYL